LINEFFGKIFGTNNERQVKRLMPRVEAINALEAEMQNRSDEQLRAKTDEFRARIQERLGAIPDEADASTRFSKKHSPWFAKLDGVCSTCGTSTCS
jgi:preprotein translocase subunit SecA